MTKSMGWMDKTMLAAAALAGISFLTATAKADATADGAAGTTYKSKCAMCHGADGKGQTPTGKSLKLKDLGSEEVQKMSDADMAELISKGKGKMPASKALTPDQVKGLVKFVRSFGKKK